MVGTDGVLMLTVGPAAAVSMMVNQNANWLLLLLLPTLLGVRSQKPAENVRQGLGIKH
jgi:hypothetical protein